MRIILAAAALGSVGCKGDCTALADGDWVTDGAAGGGMEMQGVLTMDAKACTFTLDQWSMDMTNLPSGGSVEVDQVTLIGDNIPPGCVGTANEDGTDVTGACEDGAAFSMHQGTL